MSRIQTRSCDSIGQLSESEGWIIDANCRSRAFVSTAFVNVPVRVVAAVVRGVVAPNPGLRRRWSWTPCLNPLRDFNPSTETYGTANNL